MVVRIPKAVRLVLACGVPVLSGLANIHAQSERSWVGLTGGNWFASENWNPSTSSPNGAGDRAVFTSRPLTQLFWTGTITLGALSLNGTPTGNLDLGNAGGSSDILALEQPVGASPSITNSTSRTLSIYANLQGTNGFTKNGTGSVSFRYNAAEMNLSGPVIINAGSLVIDNARSIGTGNITFTGSATLNSWHTSPASSSIITHASNRTVTINPGATATFINGGSSTQTRFNGPIRGGGNIVFSGQNGDFTLMSPNNYTGTTTLTGAKVALSNSNISSGILTLGGNNSLLDLGGANQTVANLVFPSTGSAPIFQTISNGTLMISGTQDRDFGARPNGSVIDLSGLFAFSSNHSGGNFTVRTSSGNATNTVRLASGSNSITANSINFGGASASGSLNVVNVVLGGNNIFRANALRIGSSNSSGIASFQAGLSNRTFSLRGIDGTSACPVWNIGETANSGISGQGSVDLSGGVLNALVGKLSIGRHIVLGNNPDNSFLTMSSGNLSASNIVLSEKVGGGTATLNSSLNQSGGNVSVSTLLLGIGATGMPRLLPTYNLTSGTLAATLISAGQGNYSATSLRALNISGNATLANLPSSNLQVLGLRGDFGGLMNIAVQGNVTFLSSNGNITLGANSTLTGSGFITKNGTNNLIFAASGGNHSFNGTLSVRQGRVVLERPLPNSTILLNGGNLSVDSSLGHIRFNNGSVLNHSSGNLSTSSLILSGTTGYASNSNGTIKVVVSNNSTLSNIPGSNLLINGTSSSANGLMGISINQSAHFHATNGSISFGSNSSLLGSGNLTKTGNGTLSIEGTSRNHTFSGNLVVSAGEVVLNGRIAAGNLILNGGSLSGNATMANATLNSGTLAPGTGTGNFTASNLTWNSGAIIQIDLVGRNASDQVVLSGNFNKGTGSSFVFDFKGGGSASGNYVLATFATHNFNASDFQAINVGSGLSGMFFLQNSRLRFEITGLSQTIMPFQGISQTVATVPPFAVAIPTASSGLPVALSVKSGNATVSNGTVTLTGAGLVVLAANQPGNSVYAPASEVTTSFEVIKASQSIGSFPFIPDRRLADGPFNVSPPTASSGLPVTVSRRSGPITVTGNTVTPSATGVMVLQATQSGNAFFSSANVVTTSFQVWDNPVNLTVVTPAPEDGSITAGFEGVTSREVGVTYSITATPSSGMRFVRWLSNGSEVSLGTTYSFSLSGNTTLQPIFEPHFVQIEGTYNGLIGNGSTGIGSAQDMSDFPAQNGFISIALNSTGDFTGNMSIDGQTNPLSGSFGSSKFSTATIPRSGKTAAVLQLNLNTALPGEISGNLTIDSISYDYVAPRGSYTASSPITYSLVLPTPEETSVGHGHATLLFRSHSSSARGTFAGRLSTNETFSFSAQILDSGNNTWVLPVYTRLTVSGNNTGLLTGEVIVPKSPLPGEPTATASLQWLRLATSSSPFYPAGFLVQLAGNGTVLNLGNGTSMLTGTSSSGDFILTLDPQSQVLSSTLNQSGRWTSSNSAFFLAPVSSNLSMGAVATTGDWIGTYSGTFLRPAVPSAISTRFYGNVLTTPVQIDGIPVRGAGYFLTSNASIPVILRVP